MMTDNEKPAAAAPAAPAVAVPPAVILVPAAVPIVPPTDPTVRIALYSLLGVTFTTALTIFGNIVIASLERIETKADGTLTAMRTELAAVRAEAEKGAAAQASEIAGLKDLIVEIRAPTSPDAKVDGQDGAAVPVEITNPEPIPVRESGSQGE